MSKDIFERLNKRQDSPPKPERTIPRGPLLQPIVPPSDYRTSSPTEQLLDFIINHWRKDTISVRDICWRGPNSLRNQKSAIGLAETLAENGWLAPIKSRRRDMREWRIVRGPRST